MSIVRTLVYRFRGKDYPTFAKAKDAAENAVYLFLRERMIVRGFSESEAFKVATILCDYRNDFAALLNYPDTDLHEQE